MAFVKDSPVSIELGFGSTFRYSVRAFHVRAYSENHASSKA